ncbi:hypothetical protein AAFC00_002078 [Neodothiora populina]|uniref:3-oxo-5-alpha-steroid 4-dehydrogenase C-terminal domain-containing protein n=1 Tax=Neodothiora populina TaxID=2781224 RepID=A0ABR3PG98_9PEZI
MASKPITLTVKPRGKPISRKLPKTVSAYLQGNTSDLYHRLAAEAGVSIHRLRLTVEDGGALIPNAKDFTVERTGLKNDSVVLVKDLGPQIAWQTVFIIEYLGPVLFYPLFYYLRPYIYSNAGAPSDMQTLSTILLTLHFVKRELETIFVHRFSSATMPAFNIFKNSGHYWIFGGLNIAYWINRPDAPTAAPSSPLIKYAAIALFLVGELGNLNAHLTLRGLRSAGGTERGIPKGLGFGLVTCPNYLFETIAWVGMWLATWSLSTGLFIVIAVAQMAAWAWKKEKRYRKEFGDKYQRKRFAMLPGIV